MINMNKHNSPQFTLLIFVGVVREDGVGNYVGFLGLEVIHPLQRDFTPIVVLQTHLDRFKHFCRNFLRHSPPHRCRQRRSCKPPLLFFATPPLRLLSWLSCSQCPATSFKRTRPGYCILFTTSILLWPPFFIPLLNTGTWSKTG